MQVWGARDKASTDTLVRATLDLLRAEYELRWQHYPPPLLGVGPAAEEGKGEGPIDQRPTGS